ncbi:MAG: hypothetical protein IJZ10_01770, partial [Thermoguttaceae bacterium]|nr:hypothetical protein [Thermoguttaceae bacterium]
TVYRRRTRSGSRRPVLPPRPGKDKSWIGLYEHILRCHNTRNMLREAASRDKKVDVERNASDFD